MTNNTFPLGTFFAHLADDGDVVPIEVTDDFWISGTSELPPGRLVSRIRTDGDWTSWEMHPNGDELIYQLSGDMELILDQGDLQEVVTLNAGDFVVVPKGVWHTANAAGSSEAVYITLGAGTEHRER